VYFNFTRTSLSISKPWLLQLFVPGTDLQTVNFCICIISLALTGASQMETDGS